MKLRYATRKRWYQVIVCVLTALCLQRAVIHAVSAPTIDTGAIAAALMARTSFQVTIITTGANGPGTFDGRYFNQPQAMSIKDSEGQYTFYYVKLGSRNWFALTPPKWVAVGAGSDNEKYAQRLEGIVSGGIFASLKSGVSAKLSKASENVSGIPCDEYAWTDDTAQLSACLDPVTYLPVRKNVNTGTLQMTILFSHYGDSLNGFKIPGESTDSYYTMNAHMALNTLDNFRYTLTVKTQKSADAAPVTNFSQGSYDQGNAAWQADQWYNHDSANGVPDEQYVQIGLTRWASTLKQAKGQFVQSDLSASPSVLPQVDIPDQIGPLALWQKIDFVNSAGKYQPDKTRTFQGKTATAYTYHFSSDSAATVQANEDITLYVLTDSHIPVYIEDVLLDAASKITVTTTWELTAMNDSSLKITPPQNVTK